MTKSTKEDLSQVRDNELRDDHRAGPKPSASEKKLIDQLDPGRNQCNPVSSARAPPVSWLDTLLDRGMQAKRDAAPPVSAPAIPKAATPRQPKPEIKTVIVQTRRPRDSDPGAVEIGYYLVDNGVVTLCDEGGKPTGGQQQLAPGDNPRLIAGRMTREVWLKRQGEGDFNRKIVYPDKRYV